MSVFINFTFLRQQYFYFPKQELPALVINKPENFHKPVKDTFALLCLQNQMKAVFHHTTHLICVINCKNYWGENMFTQGQVPKNEGFVRDAFAGRKGCPFCFRQKWRWDAREPVFLSCSARAALWFSSHDWNKGFKVCYQVRLYNFLWSGWQQYLPTS